MIRRAWAVLSALVAVGCSQNYNGQVAGTPAPRAAPAVPTAATPLVESPDYAAWKRYKPGTAVTRVAVTTRTDNANRVVATETVTLVALSESEVKLSCQKTVERVGEDARTDVSPPERRASGAAFVAPAGMTAADFDTPARNAKSTGTESVTAAGTAYPCRVYKFTNGTEVGPITITVWWSDDMPGRLVKQTILSPTGNATVETVVAVVLP